MFIHITFDFLPRKDTWVSVCMYVCVERGRGEELWSLYCCLRIEKGRGEQIVIIWVWRFDCCECMRAREGKNEDCMFSRWTGVRENL